MREAIRMLVLIAAVFGGYFLVHRFMRLAGWKKHVTAWLAGLLVAGSFIGATETDEERAAKAEKTAAAKIQSENDRAEKAALKAAEEDKRKAEIAAENMRIDIKMVCERAVKAKLTSPKSADFSMFKERLVMGDNGEWVLSNEVDVKNAFGADVRHVFTCVAEVRDGKVSVRRLAFAK